MKTLLLSVLASLAVSTKALAIDAAPIKPPSSITIGGAGATAIGLACTVLQWLFTGAIIFSILMALWAAIEYMRSAGDPAMIKTATNRLIYAAIGVAVAIIARTLPILVGSIFGVSSGLDIGASCT